MAARRTAAEPQSRPSRAGRKPSLPTLIWLAVVFACAGLVGAAGWATWNGRDRAVERATVTSQNLTRVLKQHTERVIDSVDMLLKMVARELGPDTANPARRSTTTAALAYLTQDLPHVLALHVMDGASGEVLFEFVRARDIETGLDPASIKALRATPHVSLAIGAPLRDPANGWMLPVSRRIGGREGIPGNVVVAYLSLDYFQKFIAQLDFDVQGSISLVRSDGIMLSRHPFGDRFIGRNISNSPLFSAGLAEAADGVYENVSVADGVRRIFAYRRLHNLPLLINVGISKAQVLAAWQSQAQRDLALVLAAVFLLLAAGAFLSREVRRRDAAESALSTSEERLRLALRAGRMVAWERDLATGYVTRSDNAGELLGLSSGPASQFFDRVDPADREKALMGSFPTPDGAEYRFIREDGAELWLATRTIRPEHADGRVIGITFDITERKLAEEQAWRAAHSDALTGLANRAFFQTELDRAFRAAEAGGGAISLLLLDLDDFKTVNDTHGHDAGDVLLMETAARITRALDADDFAARLGGDEFAIVLRDRSRAQTLAAAESLLRTLQEPVPYNDLALTTRASIGIALHPEHDCSPAGLMKDADMALYAAKSQGRSRVVAYSAEMRRVAERRSTVARNILRAVAERQIVPYYQPKVCLGTGKVVGFEALARWRHPDEGLLTPTAFGSAFDDPELAVAIGGRVLEQVMLDIREWLERGVAFGRVAVNLSTAEFREPGLGDALLGRLAAAAVPACHLDVEVTETVFLGRSSEHVAAALKRLRDGGVRIALDDFGTGYASLTHLKQFPVDEIKIDRTFVRDMERDRDDSAIVTAVIGLGRSLGLSVVAEGVESPGQAAHLRAHGCHFAQGFLFAKPMAASRVPWFLSQPVKREPVVSSAA